MADFDGNFLKVPKLFQGTWDNSDFGGNFIHGAGVIAAPPDIEAPTIGNFDPPLGTILEATQAVSFDVLDNLGAFARIIAGVRFTDGVEEIIHDGDSFTGFYALQSSRVVVATGFRYSVLRQGGWPTAPTFRIFPIDSSGNDGS